MLSETVAIDGENNLNMFIDSSAPETIALLQSIGTENVIFGAGRIGWAVSRAAHRLGVPIVAFCDNNPELVGGLIQGIPILSPEQALVRHPNAFYFIAIASTYSLIPWLRERGLAGRCLTVGIIRVAFPEGSPDIPATVLTAADTAARSQKNLMREEGFFPQQLDLIVTDRCSLRCRDCCNHIPYVRNPANRDPVRLLRVLDGVLSCVDGVERLHILGGDGLMHPDIAWLTEQAAAREKIGKIVVFTNAVIPLDEARWASLGGGKASFHVTDYGLPAQKTDDFARAAARMGIACRVRREECWFQFRIGGPAHPDAERNRRVFLTCMANRCPSIYDERMYRCAPVHNAVGLGTVPDDPDNYIDLSDVAMGKNADRTRETMRTFLFDKTGMSACAHCSGVIPGAPRVEPAEQLRGRTE